jgi:hypothetical protein
MIAKMIIPVLSKQMAVIGAWRTLFVGRCVFNFHQFCGFRFTAVDTPLPLWVKRNAVSNAMRHLKTAYELRVEKISTNVCRMDSVTLQLIQCPRQSVMAFLRLL